MLMLEEQLAGKVAKDFLWAGFKISISVALALSNNSNTVVTLKDRSLKLCVDACEELKALIGTDRDETCTAIVPQVRRFLDGLPASGLQQQFVLRGV